MIVRSITRVLAAVAAVFATIPGAIALQGSAAYAAEPKVGSGWVCSVPDGYVAIEVGRSFNECRPWADEYRYRVRVPQDGLVACRVPAGWTYDQLESDDTCWPGSTAYKYKLRIPANGLWACQVPAGWTYDATESRINVCKPFLAETSFRLRNASQVQGTINANPTTLTLQPNTTGTSTITWTGPANGSLVRKSIDGGTPTHFASTTGSSGSQPATGIQPGRVYEFRLYPNGASLDAPPLATTTVRGVLAATGTISANPSTLTLPAGTFGSTVVSWDSDRAGGTVVYGSMDGGPEILFASRTEAFGSQQFTLIEAGHEYQFRLYPTGSSAPSQPLATTTVRGILAGPATISASPSTLSLPPNTTGSTMVSWNAAGTNVAVYVSMNGAGQTPFAAGGSTGSAAATWIVAGNVYEFRLYSAGYSDPAHLLATTTVRGVLAS